MECLDEKEQSWVEDVLAALRTHSPASGNTLEQQLTRVKNLSTVTRSFPSLLTGGNPEGGVGGDLVESLCAFDSGMSSFNLPLRALMGDAFLTARVQLFQSFRLALRAIADQVDGELLRRGEQIFSQSVYTLLLGELLWDLVRNTELSSTMRKRSATELVRLWETPDLLKVADFFPMLGAVWRARNEVTVIYGTLAGVSEMFQLVQQDCPPLFVSWFTDDNVGDEEREAFREFLLGLPQEELKRLRTVMYERGMDVVDRKTAIDVLRSTAGLHEPTAEALYASFRRREKACQYRRLLGAEGPRNTAEGYLVLRLLASPSDTNQDP